jgi:ABC-type spermidine/putrescine transport system permease subunit I
MVPGLALFLIAYVPSLLIICVMSFQTHVPGGRPEPTFTLDNYTRFLGDPYYLGLLVKSMALSAIAAVIAVVIAYPVAYLLIRSRRFRIILLPVLALSFFVSSIVRLYGWLGILGRGGPVSQTLMDLGITSNPLSLLFTDAAIVIGLADFAIPYAALILASSINNVDPSVELAAQNLGATRWQSLLRVTVPLTYPGILAALVLGFALSVSAVITPIILGGGRVQMLSTQIYVAMLTAFNYPFASAMIIITLIVVSVLVVTTGRALRRRGASA